MSRSPTSRSPDLQRLAEEGYSLSLLGGTLVVEGLPYVDGDANVLEGMLIVPLRLAGDITARPDGHLAWWIGRTPCDARGAELTKLIAAREGRDHGSGLRSTHMLCNKPVDREFRDYHELVTAYSQLLGSHAEAKAPGTMSRFSGPALRLRAMPASGPDAPQAAGGYVRRADASACFTYNDTASARAGIEGLNARLAGSNLAIVGLGGTGSHVLDLVAKTPVASIHLFDADVFEQHNAFRAPGAATSADVAAGRRKVHQFAAVYSAIHNGVIPHDVRLGPSNLDLLDAADFVFLCIDDGAAKRPILDRLDARGVPWIDVGMGLRATTEGIVGALRVTVGMTPHHDLATSHVPMEAPARDAYSTNIQVGDLNALNAALAVVEWKRMRGFYAHHAPRTNSVFIVEEGELHSAERPEVSSPSASVGADPLACGGR